MKRITFHNRERETDEIMKILDADPTLITFIYGPINSGKTELINNLIKTLPESQKVFYINLRGRFISNCDEFIKVLFDVEHEARYERIKEFLKPIVNVLPESYSGIPIPKDVFLNLFKEKEVEDAFVYIETVLRAFYKNDQPPVLVIDELQVIGDLKVDDLLIYKLFNFFVRLTKELHLAHVFVVSSDSLAIEQVYSEAMLEGRCRYLLVDDFDRETTAAFLEEHGFTDDETSVAWDYFGGKPVYLIELANYEKKVAKAEELLVLRTGEIETILKRINELGGEIIIEGIKYSISYEKLVGALKKFIDHETIDMNEVDEISKAFLVKKNILFVDPLRKIIKPQSRLDLLALREVISDA
uniref:Putative ATP-binding protein n=1 Tax=Candidatus Methanogaster sp. ANME-2c ERB4 TaxID=2759911 RepID=A0A7G9YNI9_9EURY|nr:putative ATP-binding protein [Methanosarcinales archaeon ANME-2c ERB4]